MKITRDDARSLGSLVASARRFRGWTQRDLAERADVSATFISKIECGRVRSPSHGPLLAVAALLDIELDGRWEEARLQAAAEMGEILARFKTVANYGPLKGAGWLELATGSAVPNLPRRGQSVVIEIRLPEPDISVDSYGDKTLVRLDYKHPSEVTIRGLLS